MDRLKGLGTFVVVTIAVLGALRLTHLAVPMAFPNTRPGPIVVASLEEVRRRVGFAPLIPAYHPAALGSQPVSLTIWLSPPAFEIVWRQGAEYLSVTQRRGGSKPQQPPLAQPLTDVADSMWWTDGARSHVVLSRDGFWIEIETSLPSRDLRRFADTLGPLR